jgi:hypothetical protein
MPSHGNVGVAGHRVLDTLAVGDEEVIRQGRYGEEVAAFGLVSALDLTANNGRAEDEDHVVAVGLAVDAGQSPSRGERAAPGPPEPPQTPVRGCLR